MEKFVGDEVMAVFGVPVVHEDDALRAVRAAVAVRDCVAELDRETGVSLEVRIGLNTGEVVTADPSAGHGFVSGDAVAVGKRLEQAAAPGEIVLGESTHRLVEHAVQATPLDPLTLKGKADEAIAFRLESVDPDATAIPRRDDTPLVGQQIELQRLRSAYDEAASSGARLVTIVGDSGIGKSRLTRELLRSVEGDASVVVASCPPYGEGTTFSPIREAFRQAGRDESVLERSSYEVFAATRSLFEDLARERPLVAVFDDIHWAEETLLDLIEHLSVRLGTAPRACPLPRPPGAGGAAAAMGVAAGGDADARRPVRAGRGGSARRARGAGRGPGTHRGAGGGQSPLHRAARRVRRRGGR